MNVSGRRGQFTPDAQIMGAALAAFDATTGATTNPPFSIADTSRPSRVTGP
jgi:hypothetical protein